MLLVTDYQNIISGGKKFQGTSLIDWLFTDSLCNYVDQHTHMSVRDNIRKESILLHKPNTTSKTSQKRHKRAASAFAFNVICNKQKAASTLLPVMVQTTMSGPCHIRIITKANVGSGSYPACYVQR